MTFAAIIYFCANSSEEFVTVTLRDLDILIHFKLSTFKCQIFKHQHSIPKNIWWQRWQDSIISFYSVLNLIFQLLFTFCFLFFVCNWVFSNENTQSWNYLEILIFFFTEISLFTFIQISFVFFIEIKSLFWFSIKNQFWVNKNKHQIFFSWF